MLCRCILMARDSRVKISNPVISPVVSIKTSRKHPSRPGTKRWMVSSMPAVVIPIGTDNQRGRPLGTKAQLSRPPSTQYSQRCPSLPREKARDFPGSSGGCSGVPCTRLVSRPIGLPGGAEWADMNQMQPIQTATSSQRQGMRLWNISAILRCHLLDQIYVFVSELGLDLFLHLRLGLSVPTLVQAIEVQDLVGGELH